MSEQAKFSVNNPDGKNYAYELTQKLTYYVVTAELVFCGYVLLNADKLTQFNAAAYLFASSGLAAALGLLWRFCYNMTYHAHAHADQSQHNGYFESCEYKVAKVAQLCFYYGYVFLSTASLLCILGYGFVYIRDYSELQGGKNLVQTLKAGAVPVQSNDKIKPMQPTPSKPPTS